MQLKVVVGHPEDGEAAVMSEAAGLTPRRDRPAAAVLGGQGHVGWGPVCSCLGYIIRNSRVF